MGVKGVCAVLEAFFFQWDHECQRDYAGIQSNRIRPSIQVSCYLSFVIGPFQTEYAPGLALENAVSTVRELAKRRLTTRSFRYRNGVWTPHENQYRWSGRSPARNYRRRKAPRSPAGVVRVPESRDHPLRRDAAADRHRDCAGRPNPPRR